VLGVLYPYPILCMYIYVIQLRHNLFTSMCRTYLQQNYHVSCKQSKSTYVCRYISRGKSVRTLWGNLTAHLSDWSSIFGDVKLRPGPTDRGTFYTGINNSWWSMGRSQRCWHQGQLRGVRWHQEKTYVCSGWFFSQNLQVCSRKDILYVHTSLR
jgi:hypothetical protein